MPRQHQGNSNNILKVRNNQYKNHCLRAAFMNLYRNGPGYQELRLLWRQ